MQHEKTPNLSLNHETGYYEGTLLVQIDAEIFRRMVMQAIQEDETVDLTDPQAMYAIVARIANVGYWMNRPNVKITPISPSEVKQEAILESPHSENWGGTRRRKPAPKVQEPKRQKDILEARLRESAMHDPPHLWEERCLTPIAPMTLPEKQRKDIGRLRYDERQVLKKLNEEYVRGEFSLDPEAEEQEREHQAKHLSDLNVKMEAVAEAVNGSRHH